MILAQIGSRSSDDSKTSANSSSKGSRASSKPDIPIKVPPKHLGYKSYEHHLKPEDARQPPVPKRAVPRIETSPLAATSSSSLTARPPTPGRSSTPASPPPQSPGARGTFGSPFSTPSSPLGWIQSPLSAAGDSSFMFPRTHHTHHSRYLRSGKGKGKDGNARSRGVNPLPPEKVIEAIFNPHPSIEEGPFTYIPHQPMAYISSTIPRRQGPARVVTYSAISQALTGKPQPPAPRPSWNGRSPNAVLWSTNHPRRPPISTTKSSRHSSAPVSRSSTSAVASSSADQNAGLTSVEMATTSTSSSGRSVESGTQAGRRKTGQGWGRFKASMKSDRKTRGVQKGQGSSVAMTQQDRALTVG